MGKIRVNLKGAQPTQETEESAPTHGSRYGYGQQQPRQQQQQQHYGYGSSPYDQPTGYYDQQPSFPPQYRQRQQPQRQQQPIASAGYPYQQGQPTHPYGASVDPFQQFFTPQRRSSHPSSSSIPRQPIPQQRPYPSPPPPPPSTSVSPIDDQDSVPPLHSSSRNEGALLGTSGKQYSMASTQTFTKLDTIKAKFNDLLSQVNDIETTTNKEEMDSLLRSKNLLAQISGDIDRLQFTGLDAIDTSLLHTGKDEARTKRKKLNHDIEELQEHVQELHRIYGDMGAQMTQHEEETQRKKNEAVGVANATSTSEDDSSSEMYEDTSEGPSGLDSTREVATQSPQQVEEEEVVGEESSTFSHQVPQSTETEEGNSLPSTESNEIKRADEEQEEEKTPTEEEEGGGETEEQTAVAVSEEKESSTSPTAEEIISETETQEDQQVADQVSQDVIDSIDMADWVLEDSSAEHFGQNEVENLKRLLREKEELVNDLQRQILEKDKLIQELQSATAASSL